MSKGKKSEEVFSEELTYLDPERLDVRSASCGFLEVSLDGGEAVRVKPVRTFPISSPNQHILLVKESGEEVGFIRNLGEVRRGDRRKLREALGRGYFIPSITRINELRYRFHVLYFDVETDRGPTKFELRDRTENLTLLGSGKLVAEDVDGNRYVVDDINALDPRSRALLDPHI